MTDTFEFTLDEESEKRLYDILTDVDTEKTPSFTITDKYGNTAEYVKAERCCNGCADGCPVYYEMFNEIQRLKDLCRNQERTIYKLSVALVEREELSAYVSASGDTPCTPSWWYCANAKRREE